MKILNDLEKQVQQNPNDPSVLLRLANQQQDMRIFSKAVGTYEKYLTMVPADANARVDLGVSYFELSLTDSVHGFELGQAAIASIEKALTFAPRHQAALLNLGIISLQFGDLKKSREWLKKCAAIDTTTDPGKKAQQLLNQHNFTNP